MRTPLDVLRGVLRGVVSPLVAELRCLRASIGDLEGAVRDVQAPKAVLVCVTLEVQMFRQTSEGYWAAGDTTYAGASCVLLPGDTHRLVVKPYAAVKILGVQIDCPGGVLVRGFRYGSFSLAASDGAVPFWRISEAVKDRFLRIDEGGLEFVVERLV